MKTEGAILNLETRYECVTCTCGLVFAVPADVRSNWRDTGKSFMCPMGHPLAYKATDIHKLRTALERANSDKEWHRQRAADERAAREKTARRLTATRGAHTRTRNRIKNGVCPCCNRTFLDLQRHMHTKHPEFKPEDLA